MNAQARNPFTLRVGQLMTGFGVGCGIGLGVGYPIALGSIPVLGEMMSATSNAGSRAFGGVGHKAFGMLRKLGIKNLKAGVGCGVGIGHGFGVGIALKPGVSQQIAHSLRERLSAVASQLQKHLPSAASETQETTENLETESQQESTAGESFRGNHVAVAPNEPPGSISSNASSVLKTEPATITSSRGNGEVEDLRQENEILRTDQRCTVTSNNVMSRMNPKNGFLKLLRHQDLIEDLKGQNASILRVLSEQFHVQIGGQEMDPDRTIEVTLSDKVSRKNETLHYFHSHSKNPRRKCFDCRISARRRR